MTLTVTYVKDLFYYDGPLIWRGYDPDRRPVIGCVTKDAERGGYDVYMATVVTKAALTGLLAGRFDTLSMFREHAQEPLMTGVLSTQPATFEVDPQINPEDHVGAGLYCGPSGQMPDSAATA